MPVLSNHRHELFAQQLAKGKTADEAYQIAGYAENRANACRLKADERVSARVEELLNRGAERAEVTVESIMRELEEARLLAEKIEQPSSMVSAIIGKAKVKGLIIDRREQGEPGAFDNMDEDQLQRAAAEKAAALGLKVVGGTG